MKKRFIFACMVWLFVFLIYNNNYGYCKSEEDHYIRVGLKRASNVNNYIGVKGKDSFEIGYLNDEDSFAAVIDNFSNNDFYIQFDEYYNYNDGKHIRITENTENTDCGPIHLEIKKEFKSYEDVQNYIKNNKKNGVKLYPAYDGEFKVWCGQFRSVNEANKYKSKLKYLNKSLNVINNDKFRVLFIDQEEILLAFNLDQNLFICSKEKSDIPLVNVDDKKYRGYITFTYNDGELIPINYIKLNEYLYGVVAKEISSTWPIESIKAQAVAARNYAIIYMGKNTYSGYDLDDTQNNQAYEGYGLEKTIINKAVDETKNIVVKYKGKIVPTYYHSTSGGHTENSENIWENYVGYLRGVEDYFSLGSPNDSWELILKKEEIDQILKENEYDIGSVENIKILESSEYGRVLQLLIQGTKDSIVFNKGKARLVFGTRKLKSNWFDIYSDADVCVFNPDTNEIEKSRINNMSILSEDKKSKSKKNNKKYYVMDGEQIKAIPNNANEYTILGRGWGHGLGMSQWGSKTMAEQGYSYKEILSHYYTDITIEHE